MKEKIKMIPRSRMHNPEGGGYKKHTIVHKDRIKKLEDKIFKNGKISKNDLIKHLELNLENNE